MLRRIELERFRGFAGLTAEMGSVTAIVGRNSSGKTSMLHAVRLVCEALALALEDETVRPRIAGGSIEVCREVVVSDPTRLVALADWRHSSPTPRLVKASRSRSFSCSTPVTRCRTRTSCSRTAATRSSR